MKALTLPFTMAEDPTVGALRKYIKENSSNMLPDDVRILERNLDGLETEKIWASELNRDMETLLGFAQNNEFYTQDDDKRAALLGAAVKLREARDALPEDRKNK